MNCPFCKEKVSRRRRGGCPKCGQQIELIKIGKKSHYVPTGLDAGSLVTRLESHIRSRPGMKHFSFGHDSHRWKQIAMAKLLLLRCNFDQKLAEEVVDVSCTDSRIYPPKTMAGVIGKQFPTTKAIALENLEKEQEKLQVQDRRCDRIGGMEAVTLYAL